MIGADDLSAIAGAVASIGALVAAAYRPVRRIDQRLHALEDGQADLKTEMSPNHGTSLRDAVNATKSSVDALSQRFDDHLRYHGRER